MEGTALRINKERCLICCLRNVNCFSLGIIKSVHRLKVKRLKLRISCKSRLAIKVLTLMLANIVKPQAQIRANPSVTRMPTHNPIDRSSPHSHIGPNFPLFTSKTFKMIKIKDYSIHQSIKDLTCILHPGNLTFPDMDKVMLDLKTPESAQE